MLSIINQKDYTKNERLSKSVFNFFLGLMIGYGFFIGFFICFFMIDSISYEFDLENIPLIVHIAEFLFFTVLGILIMRIVNNFFINFIGYNILIISTSCFLYHLEPAILILTGVFAFFASIFMTIIGVMQPDFFLNIKKSILVGLLIGFGFYFLCIFFTNLLSGNFSLFDIIEDICDEWLNLCIVAVIFGLFGYIWSKINKHNIYTLNVTIDGIAELYLDIVNFFPRILNRILGKNN